MYFVNSLWESILLKQLAAVFISVFTRKMPFVVIFRPGTAPTAFFSSEISETGFSSFGRAQTRVFSRQSRLLAFLRHRRVFGFSSPVTSKLAFLHTARRYMIFSKKTWIFQNFSFIYLVFSYLNHFRIAVWSKEIASLKLEL